MNNVAQEFESASGKAQALLSSVPLREIRTNLPAVTAWMKDVFSLMDDTRHLLSHRQVKLSPEAQNLREHLTLLYQATDNLQTQLQKDMAALQTEGQRLRRLQTWANAVCQLTEP